PELLDGQRQDRDPHGHGQKHDRPAPRDAEVVVVELDDGLQHVLDLLQNEKELDHEDTPRRSSPGTGSYPPFDQGLQRSSLQLASTRPRTTPWRRIACSA